MPVKVVIVGGVAGGMSCAARIKRLDDDAQVTVIERGPDISFSNCGMPYFVGGTITNRNDLLLETPESLKGRYDLDVRVRHLATAVDPQAKKVSVKNLDTGEAFDLDYDYLVLSPGADPIRPPIPGADGPNVCTLRDMGDMDRIASIASKSRTACVVGAGFIGLEMAENMVHRDLDVSIVEMFDQVFPAMDWEMTQPLANELKAHGVKLHLSAKATAIEEGQVVLDSGEKIPADLVCMSVGVKPATELAAKAGLRLGPKGHIVVDEQMRTSDVSIFAVGDAVEQTHLVTGRKTGVPLAGPANRQARVAGSVICGRDASFAGVWGTSICKVFDLAAGSVGISEKQAKELGMAYRKVYTHPTQHPRYYPGVEFIGTKLLFQDDGTILGAQAVGKEGVEVIIDIIATAMAGHLTVFDLEDVELAYSPQWGNPKHGINMMAYVAANMIRGDVDMLYADDLPENVMLIDVRGPQFTEKGVISGSTIMPAGKLRKEHETLPKDRPIALVCNVGRNSYMAYRFMKSKGFDVYDLCGGLNTWKWYHPERVEIPADN